MNNIQENQFINWIIGKSNYFPFFKDMPRVKYPLGFQKAEEYFEEGEEPEVWAGNPMENLTSREIEREKKEDLTPRK